MAIFKYAVLSAAGDKTAQILEGGETRTIVANEDLAKTLDKLGKEGWELVAVVPTSPGDYSQKLFFKRHFE